MAKGLSEAQRNLMHTVGCLDPRSLITSSPDRQEAAISLEALGYVTWCEDSAHSLGNLYVRITDAGRALLESKGE